MKFEDVLAIYESYLFRIRRYKRSGYYSQEYLDGMRIQNLNWFRDIVLDNDLVGWRRIDVDLSKFIYEGQEPLYVIIYRDVLIPIYNDEYGQQVFAVIGGKEFSGGAYNSFPEDYFTYEADKLLEKRFLEE